MSLLDQLSSLCVSSFNNYNSTLFSFDDNSQPTYQSTNQQQSTSHNFQQKQLSHSNSIQLFQSLNNSQSKKQFQTHIKQQKPIPSHIHQSSERKMIRLFDDQQINQYSRFVKTDKKKSIKKTISQQQRPNQVTQTLQPFIITPLQFQPNNKDQNLQIKLIKFNYLVKNKLQKLNYEFFVKLEQYNKCIKREMEQEQREKMRLIQIQQDKKRQTRLKNIHKLVQTIDIINLKYIELNKITADQYGAQTQSNKYTQQDLLSLILAFQQIKKSSLLISSFNKIQIIMKKVIYRKFFKNIQQNKKINMKIQFFCLTVEGFFNGRKKKEVYKEVWKRLKVKEELGNDVVMGKEVDNVYVQNNYFKEEEEQVVDQVRKEYQKNQYFDFSSIKIHQQILPLNLPLNQPQNKQSYYNLKLTQSYSLSLPKSKTISIQSIQLQLSYTSSTQLNYQNNSNHHRFQTQTIPTKLNHLKSHEQQININDCIDNGHLMMNQMKNNRGFYQELQNLTISKINSHSHTNNNSSLNSSVLGFGEFILPQARERKFTNKKSIQNQNQIYEIDDLNSKNGRNNFLKNRNIQVESQRECKRDDQVEIGSSQAINSYSLLTTMRKPNIQQTCQRQENDQKTMKNIKKPRSSLIITKRKSSLIQNSHSSQRFSLFQRKTSNSTYNNQQTIKQSIQPQTTNPPSHPTDTSQILHNQKQIIKKMLQQLNKKYDFQNKNIQINITHKKSIPSSSGNYNKKDNKKYTKNLQQENHSTQNIIQKKLGQRTNKCKSQLSNQFNQDMVLIKQYRQANNLSQMNHQHQSNYFKQALSFLPGAGINQKPGALLASSTKKQLYFNKEFQNITNNKKDSSNKKQEQVYTINLLGNTNSKNASVKKAQNKHGSNSKAARLTSHKKQIKQSAQKLYYFNKNSNNKEKKQEQSAYKNKNSNKKQKIQRVHSSRKVSCYYNDENQQNCQYIKKQKKVSSFEKSNKLLITKSINPKQSQKKNHQSNGNANTNGYHTKKHQKKNTFMSITLLDNKTTNIKNQKNLKTDFIQQKQKKKTSFLNQPEQKSFFISQKPSTINLKRINNRNDDASEKQNILFTFQKPFFKQSNYLDAQLQNFHANDSSGNNQQQNETGDDNSIIKQYMNYIPSSSYVLLPLSSSQPEQQKINSNKQDTSLINIKQSIQILIPQQMTTNYQNHQLLDPNYYTRQKGQRQNISQYSQQLTLNNTNISYISSGIGMQQYYTGTGNGFSSSGMSKSTSKKSNIKQSLQKKRQLFWKSRQQWQQVLQKKKNKMIRQNSYEKVVQKLTYNHKRSSSPSQLQDNYKQLSHIKLNNISNIQLIKNSQNTTNKSYEKYNNSKNNKNTNYFKTKRSSLTLNQSIINQIKSKIQQCNNRVNTVVGNMKEGKVVKNNGGSIVKLFN